MTRFIFICMAFIALSFLAVPAYFGIEKEHAKLTQEQQISQSTEALSFEEIYALADDALLNDPAALNNIVPAAGDIQTAPEAFSSGFSGKSDSALEEEIVFKSIIEPKVNSAN